ncbi:MAG: S41 family peptidase [Thermomicrobium sp.]|nr:S41 family peptidase [Thermomicrobium sp.]MDW8059638.1 S41 family peptidase [Thermomicrobium sp.]
MDAKRDGAGNRSAASSQGPWILVALALFLAGILVGRTTEQPLQSSTTAAELPTAVAVFGEAWSLLHEHYVDPSALDDRRLLAGALRGLADAVGDNGHTRYLTAEELAQHTEQLSGEYSGIGVEIGERDGAIVVRDVFQDSPAERAGIRVGDILLAVDGVPVDELGLDGVVQHVRGPEGTAVTLRLSRPGTVEPFEVTVVRAKVRASTVRWALLPNDVGYVRLGSFSSGASTDLRQALETLRARGARGLVLDLRGNPGGLVDEAVDVAGLFLPPKTLVFSSRDRNGNVTEYRTEGSEAVFTAPMAVLVDGGTASAAEIVAGALQDYRRAVIVGERTFGAGTVLIEFRLQDGSALLIGTQVWITPNGRVIWRNGIDPDVTVSLGEERAPLVPANGEEVTMDDLATDPQLERAWRELSDADPVAHLAAAGCGRCP